MNISDQVSAVYKKCLKRFKERKETIQDEVVIALWSQVKELSETVRVQALKLSFLETAAAQGDAKDECSALLSRLGKL